MPIQLSRETERLVQHEIESGRFQTVDEIIETGVRSRSAFISSSHSQRRKAVSEMLEFARNSAISLDGIAIQDLREEGRR